MSSAPPEWQQRLVALPWATPAFGRESPVSSSTASKLAPTEVPKSRGRPDRPAAPLPPPMDTLGARVSNAPIAKATLPFRPAPAIPTSDRATLNLSALTSAAVALDVLTTSLMNLSQDAQILARLTDQLLAVGALSGIDAQAQERLVDYARGASGQARARLAFELYSRLTHPTQPALSREATALRAFAPSTPASVATALTTIRRGADIAIREARLRLEAQRQVTAYTQA